MRVSAMCVTSDFSQQRTCHGQETREPLVPYGKDPEGKMVKLIGMLKAKGFMTYSHENMILISPPLIITPEQVQGRNGKSR